MEKQIRENAELFKLDGKPSLGLAFPQALQHVLAMLVGNITPPMLIASTLSLPPEEEIMLTQAAMIIGGITTLLQLYPVLGFGMGLPSVMGGGSAAQANGTFGSGQFWILALVTLAVTLLCSLGGKGYVKVSGMLIGIAVGYVIALVMGGIVDFTDFNQAGFFSIPIPFHFGLEFHPDAILMMILMYVVQAVQTIGDVSSTAMGGFGRQATDQELGGVVYIRRKKRPKGKRAAFGTLLGDAELSGLPVRHGGPGVQHAAGQHLAGQLFCPPGAV